MGLDDFVRFGGGEELNVMAELAAPSEASRLAIAAPRPREAPVTRRPLPASLKEEEGEEVFIVMLG